MNNIFIVLLFTFFTVSTLASEIAIVRTSGKVLVNGVALNSKTEIISGDTVEAIGKKSFIQLKTKFGSVFLIRNGKIILEKFTKRSSLVSLLAGKFFHFYNKNVSKKVFKVKTRNAVMGVRGTKYMLDAKKNETYLCVCQGIVSAKLKDSQNIHMVNAGDDILLRKSSARKKRASSQMMTMAKNEFKAMGHPVVLNKFKK